MKWRMKANIISSHPGATTKSTINPGFCCLAWMEGNGVSFHRHFMEEEIICNRWKDLADGFFSMPGPIFPADTNDDFLFEH